MGGGAVSPGRPISVDVDPELVSAYVARGWWRDRTIVDDLYDHAARQPGKLAVISHRAGQRLGERAAAVIVPADPADPPALAELTGFLEARGMARHFWPERLVTVEELPRTATGKIQKFRLRAVAETTLNTDHEDPEETR